MGAWWLGRSRFGRRDVIDPSTEIRVLSKAGLAPKQGVALVQVGARRMTLSYGEGGVRLLSDGGPVSSGHELEVATGDAAAEGSDLTPLSLDGAGSTAVAMADHDGQARFSDRLRHAVRRATLLGALMLLTHVPAALGQTPPPIQIPAPTVAQPATAQAAQIAGQTPADAQQAATDVADEAQPAGSQLAEPAPLGPDVLWDLMQAAGIGSEEDGGPLLPGPVGAVLFVGFLTLLPTLLLLMTSFTRILVVLNLLRQAVGTQTAPPTHLLIALALLLTSFVMAPTLAQVNDVALRPWVAGEMDEAQMLSAAAGPFRSFMLSQVRDEDLALFVDMQGARPSSIDEVPLTVVTSAFVTSELRRAFQIGFAVFLPFVVIDVVVASVLMSMGMFMLPPVMVSLPFKLLLFVLVDGWALMLGGLVRSFL